MFFTAPSSTHICPKSADCWSPMMPAIGMLRPCTWVSPMIPEESQTIGIMDSGMPKKFSSSLSHCRVLMLKSMVLEALVTSVTCTLPPVRFQTSQESMVPKRSRPARALAIAPGTLSSIQRILVALK